MMKFVIIDVGVVVYILDVVFVGFPSKVVVLILLVLFCFTGGHFATLVGYVLEMWLVMFWRWICLWIVSPMSMCT